MTPRGPRQVALARFRNVLTPEVLDAAAARAARPFDRRAVLARARRLGIPVSTRRRSTAARQLLAELRAGLTLDPTVAGLLLEALQLQERQALPEHLAEAAEWLGRSDSERGRALRGLLRTTSRVLRSADATPPPPEARFPRFSSGREAA